MKTILGWVIVLMVVLQVSLSSVYGAPKHKITNNQLKAKEYIAQLRAGAKPENLTRPHLRRSDKYKSKQSNKEIREAMTRAEDLARAGKSNLIQEPVFRIPGLSK